MIKNKPDYYNNLNKIYFKIWDLLKLGLKDRDKPFHIPIFICGKNNYSDGRIVVLRGVDQRENKIWFHSDIRSNKIKILKKNPVGNMLFYDKSEKIQLRILGNVKINYKNKVTEKSWKKTAHMSRQCYLGKIAPGKSVAIPTSGLGKKIDNLKYSFEESQIGYNNFCVVELYIKTIEWLYLAAKGHRRAMFNCENINIKRKWLIP